MNSYAEGMNFVKQLEQSSPQAMRWSKPRTDQLKTLRQTTLVCYNGNYEGDSSMFENTSKSPNNRLDLIETDSDSEYAKVLENYKPKRSRLATESQLLRLWNHYKYRLISKNQSEKISFWTVKLWRSFYGQQLCNFLALVWSLVMYLLCLTLLAMGRFASWSYGLWKSRLMLRNTARRLLWCMTLAKCGDVSLFALILLATPLLFMVAMMGFILSVYCVLKEWLNRSVYFIRNRVF